MRIGEAAKYLGMSTIGVRKAADAGRLPSTITGGGQRAFERRDLDAYLGRDVEKVEYGPPRVEVLYVRVSGSGGQESSLANQEVELRGSSTGPIFRVYKDRASGLRENRAGLTALLNDAASRKFTVVRVVHKDRLARFGVGYIERALAAYGVGVEVLHARPIPSLQDELMDDFMALLASFSGRFYQLRGRENQLRLLAAARQELAGPDGPQ